MATFNYWCSNCGAKATTDSDVRPICAARVPCSVMKASGREDQRKALPHPMQPFADDGNDVTRFKPNAIVQHLLKHGGIDLNDLAMLDFTAEDRAQFAQLIGYSCCGFGDLSYVDDETYARATNSAMGGDDGTE